MADLVLHTHPGSRGPIARWMPKPVYESSDTVVPDFGSGMRASHFLAINPDRPASIAQADPLRKRLAPACASAPDRAVAQEQEIPA